MKKSSHNFSLTTIDAVRQISTRKSVSRLKYNGTPNDNSVTVENIY